LVNNCHFTGEQRKEIDAQKELVSKQMEDTTKLHVDRFVQKTPQRNIEKQAEMGKYFNPHIKR
jgi:hypothetical protein